MMLSTQCFKGMGTVYLSPLILDVYRGSSTAFSINAGGSQNKVWYPADQLTIIPWQIVKDTMEGEDSKAMIDDSERLPQVNKNYIMNDGLRILGLNPLNPFYKDFGLSFKRSAPTMIRLNALLLLPPKIIVLKDSKDINDRPELTDGGWNLAKQGVQYRNVFMTFSISVFGPEQLLLYPDLWVSKHKPRASIPEHYLSTA
ncbi:uncharacterized protein LY89DRAFT_740099 [Mollisia scopiformis]|uniref:Uncharacterized protein n=1 Tax=Mollisia scopiformis TaxID=149040 RepID=A0A132BEE8_MOLSC|nr:uncharacterized protein LY89DRAFT_740099 [Mollisia scopiformis]KUJ10379.1 hypothetical protein LY89DRAFT_740099 [Mollisia scopiformis]